MSQLLDNVTLSEIQPSYRYEVLKAVDCATYKPSFAVKIQETIVGQIIRSWLLLTGTKEYAESLGKKICKTLEANRASDVTRILQNIQKKEQSH